MLNNVVRRMFNFNRYIIVTAICISPLHYSGHITIYVVLEYMQYCSACVSYFTPIL